MLEHVHLTGPVSRAELMRRTGLNCGTVKEIVEELTPEGIVGKGDVEPRDRPGRPSRLVHARPDRLAVLAAETAVDSFAVVTVEALSGLACKVTDDRVQVVACGAAVVGIVRRDDGVVRHGPTELPPDRITPVSRPEG